MNENTVKCSTGRFLWKLYGKFKVYEASWPFSERTRHAVSKYTETASRPTCTKILV